MSRFGRHEEPRRERTAEERERARLEREARRSGVAPPPPPREPEPEPVEPELVAPEPRDPEPFIPDPVVAEEEPPAAASAPARRLRRPVPPRAATGRRGMNAPRAPRRHRPGHLATRIAALVVLCLTGAVIWFLVALFQPFAGDGKGTGRVALDIPQGATAGEIGNILADRDVVDSSFFFRLRATISGDRGDLRSGHYTLAHGMSYAAALDALTTAPEAAPTVNVTIPEGRSRRETVPLVKQAGLKGDYLKASRRSRAYRKVLDLRAYKAPKATSTYEGFLFPATYELKKSATAHDLVAKQLAAFKQRFAGIDLRYAHSKHLTPYDVVTIASMVEREAQVDSERPLIAAVIYNRLHEHMPLGIDATTRFATHNWTQPLADSDFDPSSPYDTRHNLGLPPTPIGSPGLKSLQAAAHPAKVGYLYYVVKPGTCGRHSFSSTNAQFQQDVARYNEARAENGGKSPTTCKQ